MKKIKSIIKNENGAVSALVLFTVLMFIVILMSVYLTITTREKAQIKSDIRIKEIYAQDVDNIDDVYNELATATEWITATVEGKTVTIRKDNVANYLGKVVTNYKPTVTTVTVGGTEYTVSNNYRLYYVDFDGKYGEKNGVYLKADYTSNNYTLPITDTTSADASNIKIKALNPSLYKTGVTSPNASNNNMKAVTWLLNTSNWDSLKTGASLEDKVNYVVGAPSVEMMMDSYNTKYGLTGETPDTNTLSASSNRVKLFYQYPTTVNSYNYGYEVGPNTESSAKNGYYYNTSDYSVKTDSEIDSMYYPGDNKWYWLASPSADYTDGMLIVSYYCGGLVGSWQICQQRCVLSASFSRIFSLSTTTVESKENIQNINRPMDDLVKNSV